MKSRTARFTFLLLLGVGLFSQTAGASRATVVCADGSPCPEQVGVAEACCHPHGCHIPLPQITDKRCVVQISPAVSLYTTKFDGPELKPAAVLFIRVSVVEARPPVFSRFEREFLPPSLLPPEECHAPRGPPIGTVPPSL